MLLMTYRAHKYQWDPGSLQKPTTQPSYFISPSRLNIFHVDSLSAACPGFLSDPKESLPGPYIHDPLLLAELPCRCFPVLPNPSHALWPPCTRAAKWCLRSSLAQSKISLDAGLGAKEEACRLISWVRCPVLHLNSSSPCSCPGSHPHWFHSVQVIGNAP